MSTEIDCLVIGHNQMSFTDYVGDLRQMGDRAGAFRDVNLSFYEQDGAIVSCRSHFNKYHLRQGSEAEFSYDNIFSATVAYLCTFLNRHGLSADYVNSYQEGRDTLIHTLTHKRVRSVAITTTYYVVSLPITDIVQTIRKYSPETRIIIGGPHIKTQHQIHDPESFLFTLHQIGADLYVVSSQGEQTLVKAVRALKSGAPFAGIANLIYLDGPEYRLNAITDESNNLSQNPVDWSLFSHDLGYNGRKMVMVRTANSCPFSCSFCSFPAHAGPYRYIDPSEICRELDQLDALGDVRSVTFIDDTFNVPIGRFREILKLLCQKRYRFRWNCNFRAQHADEEIVALMKEAGCEGVFLGIESGCDTILKNMNKRSRVENYSRGISWLRKHGIMTYASFIIGFPGETADTIRETQAFIESAQPDFFRAQLWYYDTMTPIHEQAEHFGLSNSQFEWAHDTMTSQEAADWVDHLHREVEHSVWLPQNDFDYPSLFNLLSRGWQVEQIKEMLRAFNARVRLKLRVSGTTSRQTVDSELLSAAAFNF